jgi:hypothetical protein
MFRRDGRGRNGFLAVLLMALLAESDEARGAEGALLFVLGRPLGPPGIPLLVARAVEHAAEKLAGTACQEVFSDFRDGEGRTLQQNLDRLGQTGAGYLRWTLFYDGTGKRACEAREILALTVRGSRAIFICAAQFSTVAKHDPGLAAALIIHEELHSLGLGEGPPDSKEITARVIARCGK